MPSCRKESVDVVQASDQDAISAPGKNTNLPLKCYLFLLFVSDWLKWASLLLPVTQKSLFKDVFVTCCLIFSSCPPCHTRVGIDITAHFLYSRVSFTVVLPVSSKTNSEPNRL